MTWSVTEGPTPPKKQTSKVPWTKAWFKEMAPVKTTHPTLGHYNSGGSNENGQIFHHILSCT